MMNSEGIIHRQNQIMTIFLWVIYFVQIMINVVLLHIMTLLWPMIGLVLLLIVTIFVLRKQHIVVTMYMIVLTTFIFMFYLNVERPHLLELYSIFLALILSSIYKRYAVTIFAGVLTITGVFYFFRRNYDELLLGFDQYGHFDLMVFILFVITYLFIEIKFTKMLWDDAYQKEKRATKQLFSTKQYYESFFNDTTDAIVVFDPKGNIITVNPYFEQLYGWSEAELFGKRMPVVPKEEFKNSQTRWKNVCEGGRVIGEEAIHTKRDGTYLFVSVTISPIFDENHEVVALSSICRDITEKKKTEEMLLRSEKLAVIGEMAAGVAHEIRNPLAVISGFIQMIHQDHNQYEQYAEVMLSELKRINFIVSEFLVLAKPQAIHFREVDVRAIVNEVLMIYETQSLMKSVVIHSEYGSDIPFIHGEPNQLKQVMINVLKNAIEAVDENGEIFIETKRKDEWILLSIIDNGKGIPKENLDNIYRPFFTTKENGTGLGLMVTQRIIENHKGQLFITSEENEGTKVEIMLPIVQ